MKLRSATIVMHILKERKQSSNRPILPVAAAAAVVATETYILGFDKAQHGSSHAARVTNSNKKHTTKL